MKVISESTTIEEVAALVSESLSRAGITAVLSGGGAVQIYSNGLYVSRDLDFVSPAPVKEIARVVKALGFEPASGRHFVHPTCPFTLEFPPWPLAVGHALIHEWAGRSGAHGVIQMVTATQRPRMVDARSAFQWGVFGISDGASLSGASSSAIPRCSLIQAPRSISRQRSLQNGRHGNASVHSTGRLQVGQKTTRGATAISSAGR